MQPKPKSVKTQVEHLRKPVPEKVPKLSRPQRRRLNKRLRKENFLHEQSLHKNVFQNNKNAKSKEHWKTKVTRTNTTVSNSFSSVKPKITKTWVPIAK